MRIRIIKCVDCGELGLCVGFQRITDHCCSGEYCDVLEAEYDAGNYIEPRYDYNSGPIAQTNRLMTALDDISEIYDSYDRSDTDWEWKYDRIFNINANVIMPLLDNLGIRLDYCDPDTSYEEDVTAYYNAIMEIKRKLEAEGY